MGSWRSKIISRAALWRLAYLAGFIVVVAILAWRLMFSVPGTSYAGEVRVEDNDLSRELHRHVKVLAEEIGDRGTYKPESYRKAADYIVAEFVSLGYTPRIEKYPAGGMDCSNIEAQITGSSSPEKILVVGAHYDTVQDSPGANDNTSGVAAVLALARTMKDSKPGCTIKFVAFANEEPPYFQTPAMGSMVYAKGCKDRGDNIIGMISLETIGYYSDEANSQRYPSPFDNIYPTTGNFIAFVANIQSRQLMQKSMGAFRKSCDFPSEGGAVPNVAAGIGWSDHWAFWQHGYKAVMVTDTAPFRYRYYHSRGDTPDKLDYPRMSKVVEGMKAVIDDLAQ